MSIDLSVCQFISPFSMIVSGPSGCGKSFFVRSFLRNHRSLIYPKFSKIPTVIWAYGQWQNLYKNPIEHVNVEYMDGLPSDDDIQNIKPDFIVIDDLMNEVADDKKLGNLFTKGSHHLNLNVIFITQNLFHQGKQMRNIHLSSHYLVIMKNQRDASQLDHLGRQLKISKALNEAYADATKKPFGYLIIDFKQTTPKEYMLKTRIFPEETNKGVFSPIFYVIK